MFPMRLANKKKQCFCPTYTYKCKPMCTKKMMCAIFNNIEQDYNC